MGVWERRVKVEGSYVFDHGENMTEFFKAIGDMVSIEGDCSKKLNRFRNKNNILLFAKYSSLWVKLLLNLIDETGCCPSLQALQAAHVC